MKITYSKENINAFGEINFAKVCNTISKHLIDKKLFATYSCVYIIKRKWSTSEI